VAAHVVAAVHAFAPSPSRATDWIGNRIGRAASLIRQRKVGCRLLRRESGMDADQSLRDRMKGLPSPFAISASRTIDTHLGPLTLLRTPSAARRAPTQRANGQSEPHASRVLSGSIQDGERTLAPASRGHRTLVRTRGHR
jgi:hypothetical protein